MPKKQQIVYERGQVIWDDQTINRYPCELCGALTSRNFILADPAGSKRINACNAEHAEQAYWRDAQ